jgi:hypothetical protein
MNHCRACRKPHTTPSSRLLYDRDPPQFFLDAPDLNGFWGYRLNVVVRPDVDFPRLRSSPKLPLRLGAAWHEHAETGRLRDSLAPFIEAGRLAVVPVHVQHGSFPALASSEFDVLQFFCHGHTNVPGLFSSEESKRLRDAYLQSSGASGHTLLMAVDDTTDSLIELNGEYVTLTKLADVLKYGMPGQPIVLLSMCESAQFTTSGTGFVPLFLRRGARAVVGSEGPSLWWLSREMDTRILRRLLDGSRVSEAFFETRRELASRHMLALIYTLYGDGDATLPGAATGGS